MECVKILTARNEERIRCRFDQRPPRTVLAAMRAGGSFRQACGQGGCWYLSEPGVTYQILKASGELQLAGLLKVACNEPVGLPQQASTLVVRKLGHSD